MIIVVAVIALIVFAALLIMDTGAVLRLAFSWAIGGPAYRWILLCALLIMVALYVGRKKVRAFLGGLDLEPLARRADPGARKSPNRKLADRSLLLRLTSDEKWRRAHGPRDGDRESRVIA